MHDPFRCFCESSLHWAHWKNSSDLIQSPIGDRVQDPSVVQNYGSLLEQLVQTVPDGLVLPAAGGEDWRG